MKEMKVARGREKQDVCTVYLVVILFIVKKKKELILKRIKTCSIKTHMHFKIPDCCCTFQMAKSPHIQYVYAIERKKTNF